MVNPLRKPKRFARRSPYLPLALPTVAKSVVKTILNRFHLAFKLELIISAKAKRSVQRRHLQERKKHPYWDASFLEVTIRFELMNNGVADRGLTTWLRHHTLSICYFLLKSNIRVRMLL